MYTIGNEFLQVSVLRVGAELCSIRSIRDDYEYIWQANPEIWGDHSPLLFPIIGRLKNDYYTFEGIQHRLTRHGFARKNHNFKLENVTTDSLIFTLEFSVETLKMYPFEFRLQVEYRLEGKKLITGYTVYNQGDSPMYFSVGGHPAFNCPLKEGEVLEDYFFEFEQNETAEALVISSEGLISTQSRPVIEGGKTINLSAKTFERSALVFKGLQSKIVRLISRKSGNILNFGIEGFPYLAFWSKPAATFVCIEPWYGIADREEGDQQLVNKEGILTLDGGENFSTQFFIEIESS